MPLLNAPEFNESREKNKKRALLGGFITVVALVLLTLAGYLSGHGWLFSDLPAEHKVNTFFSALEAKDYGRAFAIYTNDPDWQANPARHKDYPLKEFTEDWTVASPADAPITSHHVDVSRAAGSGTFGTGIIVATTVNGKKRLFMRVDRKDGSISPSPLEIDY